MDEATKAKLKEAGLEGVIKAFETTAKALADETAARKADADAHAKAIAEKDQIIEQKNGDIVGARKEYKKLSEMTEAEKQAMSAKEIELQERMEAFQQEQEAFKKSQAEILAKEVGARREAAFKKFAGTDAEARKALEDAFGKIKDSDKAQTAEEIAGVVQSAWNMTGLTAKPDAMNGVFDGGGAPGGEGASTGFAETTAGKELAASMGLPGAPPTGGGTQ